MKFNPGDIICFYPQHKDNPRGWWKVITVEEFENKISKTYNRLGTLSPY